MNKILFIVKKRAKLEKYGFVNEGNQWALYSHLKKLYIYKKDMVLHFNMPGLQELKVFHDMIKDNVIEIKKIETHPYRKTHYIGLTEEEFKMIQERRNKYE